jgi:ABC-type glycerol-3-phosphate transport system substrate-binding protein
MTTACCSAPGFTSQIPEGLDWGFAPLPKGKVATPDVQPTIAGLPALGKEREAGWTLLKYLLEGSRMASLQKRQPPIPKDVETWVRANYGSTPNARAQLLVEGTKIARAVDPIRFHPRYNEMNKDVIAPAWTEMIAGRETASQALKRIKPQLQAMAAA